MGAAKRAGAMRKLADGAKRSCNGSRGVCAMGATRSFRWGPRGAAGDAGVVTAGPGMLRGLRNECGIGDLHLTVVLDDHLRLNELHRDLLVLLLHFACMLRNLVERFLKHFLQHV